MDEQGLAAQGMGAQGDQQTMAKVQEVMQLLVSGVT
jgi:hypothetical protein